MIVLRLSRRVIVRVDAWLLRPIESGREPSSDARLRGVNVRGRSVSDPDIGDRRAERSSLKLRLILPRAEPAVGFETAMPFDRTELSEFDLLIGVPMSEASACVTVVGVTAVVGVGCLRTDGRDGSARTVIWELPDALR